MNINCLKTLYLFGILIIWTHDSAANQINYVTDELSLGMYASEKGSGERIKTLASGTKLEVIERNRNFAKVRTERGEIGWVKAGFLVDQKPAKLIVSELIRENENLQNALQQAREKLLKPESIAINKIKVLTNQLNQTTDRLKQAQQTNARLHRKLGSVSEELALYKPTDKQIDPRWFYFAAAVLMLMLGMLFGMRVVKNQMRKRLYGYRLG